ncbi:MAG: AMP-binding protein [Polyangiaceae bacterium]
MPHTDLTLGEYFDAQVEARASAPFILFADRDLHWSYAEFGERVDRVAKGLAAIGLRRGDHLGIWARNVPDWLTMFFATAKLGIVLVTINTAYRSHELAHVVRQSDMKALAFVDGFRDVNYLSVIRELIPESQQQPRGELHCAAFPQLRHLIYLGPEKFRGVINVPELMTLGEQMSDAEYRAKCAGKSSRDVINMQYTSGTTGFPKGVMLTSHNILNNGWAIGERQSFTENDRVCLPVPLFHCFGLVLGMMAVLTHGGSVVIIEQFDPLLVLAAVQKERCTALYGVPTMFIAELNHPMFELFDLRSLRTGIMAGSPCPVDTMRQVMTRMHCEQITIAYGLTESSPVMAQTSIDDTIERRTETVGTALPEVEIRIVDPETHQPVPVGVSGEICCRGYLVMKGYYGMPEETARIIDAEGWLHSGDLGEMDQAGYVRVTGRIKDMIIRGGENIYPREIEEFLYTVEGVEDAQVVGVADRKYGEVVGAFVRRKSGSELSEEDVREACRHRLARYKCPKYVFFVDSFPSTANGKIQKYKLRELANTLVKERPAPTE